jgi:hypothetical protein
MVHKAMRWLGDVFDVIRDDVGRLSVAPAGLLLA